MCIDPGAAQHVMYSRGGGRPVGQEWEIRKDVANDGLVGGQWPDFAEASGLLGDVGRGVT